MRKRSGFTLIELIVVMAITGILLTVITLPIIQGFNFTRAAQALSDAQQRARVLIDQISTELGTAAGVRDNSKERGSIDIYLPDINRTDVLLRLENCKLDILMPSAGEPLRGPNGALLNPRLLKDPNGDPNDPLNWKEDPTLRTPTGQVVLPAASGFRMVRYWIGLRDPLQQQGNAFLRAKYNNPYNDALFRGNGRDNLYVLYRAEVDFKTWNAAQSRWEYNPDLFADTNGDGTPDNVDDPRFFTFLDPADRDATNPLESSATYNTDQPRRMNAWLRRSRVVTEISRYDMIQPLVDKQTFRALYDGNIPRVLPLVQFRPTRMSNEPATGTVAVKSNFEFEGSEKIGPETYFTKSPGWANATIRFWPSQLSFTQPWLAGIAWQPGTPYQIVHPRNDNTGKQIGVSLFDYDPTSGVQDGVGGTETFDILSYQLAKNVDPNLAVNANAAWRFPFTYAFDQANGRSGWVANQAMRDRFAPVSYDTKKGYVLASFGIDEVGRNPGALGAGQDNRPISATGPAIIPSQQGASTPTDWQLATYSPSSPTSQINGRFNVLYNNWNTLVPGLNKSQCRRFVDLRYQLGPDGTPTPLNPLAGNAYFRRTRIVPGSEIVVGPDQLAGPNYGRPTRYTRVAADSNTNLVVGPNQYFINYVDRRDLDDAAYTSLGLTPPSKDPAQYTANDFASAIIQPRFRAGYLEFNSDPNQPLPQGLVSVYYKFQFTESADTIAVDYDTRKIIDISLTVRSYAPTTSAATQGISLKGSATVRNFFR